MKLVLNDIQLLYFFFRSYKVESCIVLGMMFVAGTLETLNLATLYPIINYGLNLNNANVLLAAFEKLTSAIVVDNPFLASCILLIISSILAIGSKFLYSFLSFRLLTRIVGDTQKKLFHKFINSDYGFFVKNQQGKLIYAGTTAPERTTAGILATITLGYNVINAFLLFSFLVILSWQATLFIMAIGLIYGLIVKDVKKRFISQCAKISVEENQRKNVILNEFITGIKTIKIFLAEHHWNKRYTMAVDKALNNQFRLMLATIFPEAFVKFLFYIAIASTGIYFSHKPHQEIVMLLPLLGTFALVVNRLLPSISVIGSALMKITECLPDTKIVHDLCTEEIDAHVQGQKDLVHFNHVIGFNHVWFKYSSMPDYLLKDVSFTIEKRKMTAIVGLSGSGKTTCINLLMKLYTAEKGIVSIDGVNILEYNDASYLSKIGYVSQETFLFNSTYKENIRFGLEHCTDQMIEDAAILANAHEFIKDSPHGYDTVVGDSGMKISGGQRQRIAIARAILRKPEIIIFDEATSSLDNISEKKIQKAITDISKHTTVLVIAHRLSTVEHADKIIILSKGEVREQGTHDELLKNKDLYYQLQMSTEASDANQSQESDG